MKTAVVFSVMVMVIFVLVDQCQSQPIDQRFNDFYPIEIIDKIKVMYPDLLAALSGADSLDVVQRLNAIADSLLVPVDTTDTDTTVDSLDSTVTPGTTQAQASDIPVAITTTTTAALQQQMEQILKQMQQLQKENQQLKQGTELLIKELERKSKMYPDGVYATGNLPGANTMLVEKRSFLGLGSKNYVIVTINEDGIVRGYDTRDELRIIEDARGKEMKVRNTSALYGSGRGYSSVNYLTSGW